MYETMKEALYQEDVRCVSCGTIAECFIRDKDQGDISFCEPCWYKYELDEEGNVVPVEPMEE